MPKPELSFELKGLKEFYNMLEGLPLATKAKELRSVNRKGATAYIARPTKALKSLDSADFKVKAVRGEPTAVRAGIVNTFEGRKLLWQEYGTKKRTQKTTGKRLGAHGDNTSLKPFFRALLDRQIRPMQKFIGKEYGNITDTYLKRRVAAVNRAAKRK